METDTVIQAVIAIIALVALGVAAWAVRSSSRMLRIERGRDQERQRQAQEKQASLIGAWAVFCPEAKTEHGSSRSGVLVSNSSASAVHDVVIQSADAKGDDQHPLTMTILPPGEHLMLTHRQYRWSFPKHRDEAGGIIRPVTKHAKWRVQSIEFTDARSHR